MWGNLYDDNIVWGNNNDDDNIVWGNDLGDDDNIVWGNGSQLGSVFRWSGGFVSGKASNARARRTVARGAGDLMTTHIPTTSQKLQAPCPRARRRSSARTGKKRFRF